MTRSTFVMSILSLCLGIFMFQIKYKVVDLEIEKRNLQKSITEKKRSIHTMKAEWAYLNDPKRLANLANHYLQAKSIDPDQIYKLEDIKKIFADKPQSRDLDGLFSQALDSAKKIS